MTIEKRNSRRFILLFMGMLSAFGPFVTDFYLPTLPQLTNDFETTTSLVQLTLTFSMIGLAVGQMIIGPLSDKYGRRTPLILSLALFIVSTVACLYARDIHSFLICRFIQGFAGAGDTENEAIAVEQFFAVCQNEILGDRILAVVDAMPVTNFLRLKRHKHSEGFCGQRPQCIDAPQTKRQCGN